MRWIAFALVACGMGTSTLHVVRWRDGGSDSCALACRRVTGVEPRACDRDRDEVRCELDRDARVSSTMTGDCASACGNVRYLASCGLVPDGVDCMWRIPND